MSNVFNNIHKIAGTLCWGLSEYIIINCVINNNIHINYIVTIIYFSIHSI